MLLYDNVLESSEYLLVTLVFVCAVVAWVVCIVVMVREFCFGRSYEELQEIHVVPGTETATRGGGGGRSNNRARTRTKGIPRPVPGPRCRTTTTTILISTVWCA